MRYSLSSDVDNDYMMFSLSEYPYGNGSGYYADIYWAIGKNDPADCIVSIYQDSPEVVHKLDAKYLPDNVGGGADWNAKEGEAGHVLNRIHWVEGGAVILPECQPVFDIHVSDGGTTATARQPFTQVYAKATDGSTFVRGFFNLYFPYQDTPIGTGQLIYNGAGDNGAGDKNLTFLMLQPDNEGGVQCATLMLRSDETVILTGM